MTSCYLRHARNAMGRLRRWGMFGAVAAVFVLAGCGGGASFTGSGNGGNNNPGGGTTTGTPAAINLVPSSASLPSNASTQAQGVTLTAIVTDANGVVVQG